MGLPPLYILAGGRSKRFGSDKARATVDGQPLLQRVADALAPITSRCFVVAAEDHAYADLGFTTLGDERPDHGPLGGLETALQHHQDGWIALASCDLLDPRPHHLATLIDRATQATSPMPAAVVYQTDRPQPFPGLYHSSALDAVRTGLAEAKPWGMIRLLRSLPTVLIPAPADWPAIPQANRRDRLEAWQAERDDAP